MNNKISRESISNMTIEERIQYALESKSWMLRRSNAGVSYGDFQWAAIGEWTQAPDWDASPECGGGLHGCFHDDDGYYTDGADLDFCITWGERIKIDDEKSKVEWAMVLMRNTIPPNLDVGGSLDLRGCTLPEGLQIGNVGGSLDLRGCTLPEGLQIPDVGGSLDLSGCTLPEGLQIPDVGGSLYLGGCTLPEGLRIPDDIDVIN